MSISLVTGGAHGLGAAIAQRLASGGDTVVVADVDEDSARRVADALTADGCSVEAAGVDVTDEAAVAQVVETTVSRHGGLGTLVCSAAVEVRAPLGETSDEDWRRVLEVNLKGPFLCMKHAIPAIADSGGGSVVLLGSTLAHLGSPNFAAYCASKGALVNLAKQAAIEHAPDGVRVNVVSPSATDTGLFMELVEQAPDPEAIVEMVTANNPMGRLGTADEVVETVAFLASPGATYISGTALAVDGGLAARRM